MKKLLSLIKQYFISLNKEKDFTEDNHEILFLATLVSLFISAIRIKLILNQSITFFTIELYNINLYNKFTWYYIMCIITFIVWILCLILSLLIKNKNKGIIFNVLFISLIPIMIILYTNLIYMIYDYHKVFLDSLKETIIKEHPTDYVFDICYRDVISSVIDKYLNYPYSLFYPEFEAEFREYLFHVVLNKMETLVNNSVPPRKFIRSNFIYYFKYEYRWRK